MNQRAEDEPSGGRFERNVRDLLIVAVVAAALFLFVDWGNVWAVVRPILDFLLK